MRDIMRIKFWGVRGSMPMGAPAFQAIGGDTICVSVETDNDHFIFDAGTGIYLLGRDFLHNNVKSAHLLFSHFHYDHVIGLPFFEPFYQPDFLLDIYGPHVAGIDDIDAFLKDRLFSPPFFPVKLNEIQNKLKTTNLYNGDRITIGDADILVASLNHPGGAAGYRLVSNGVTIAYISDTEHEPGSVDDHVVELIRDADLVIYDATYTEEEYVNKRGWGHSTPEQGIKLCQLANAKSLALFHHAHFHDDETLKLIEAQSKKLWDKAFLAKEGMEIIF